MHGSPSQSPRGGLKPSDSPPSRGMSPDMAARYHSENDDNDNDGTNDLTEDADNGKHASYYYQQQQHGDNDAFSSSKAEGKKQREEEKLGSQLVRTSSMTIRT